MLSTDNNRQNPAVEIFAIQRRAIPILLENGENLSDTAHRLHLHRDTIREWLRQPAFRAEYDRQLNEVVKSSISNLKLSANKALTVLNSLLNNRSPSVRFKAACRIIDSLEKFIEFEQISDRLSAIEEKQKREVKKPWIFPNV